MDFEGVRQLPYSLEAEQSVLGAILIDPECVQDISVHLRAEHFYVSAHRQIFEIMQTMLENSRTIDIVTLLDELKTKGVYDERTGREYLLQLAEFVPSTANIDGYVHIMIEKFYLRSLIEASRDISQMCYEQNSDVRTIMDSAEQKIYNIMQNRSVSGFEEIKELIIRTYDMIEKMSGDDRLEYMGVPTGFIDVDELLIGLAKSNLLILAARPGVGKTSFALNIGENVAKRTGKAVAIFSLEMSKEELVSRMLSSEAEIDSRKLRTGELDDNDWVKLAEASAGLSKSHILVDDTSGITVAEMKTKLRRVKDLGLVIIDYLQLMQGTGRSDNRVQIVADISRNLKIMAKDLNVPILVLSQLARGPEQRDDHRPRLSDLRESGSIEQDADAVLFLYRDELYNPDTEDRNVAECIIAKNRHGSTGKARLLWQGMFTKFGNLDAYHDEY